MSHSTIGVFEEKEKGTSGANADSIEVKTYDSSPLLGGSPRSEGLPDRGGRHLKLSSGRRKRGASVSSAPGQFILDTSDSLKEGGLLSPKKGSPRTESPRKSSPRIPGARVSPRFPSSQPSSTHTTPRSSDSTPRVEEDDFPLSDEIAKFCLDRANQIVQEIVAIQGIKDHPQRIRLVEGAGGTTIDVLQAVVNELENQKKGLSKYLSDEEKAYFSKYAIMVTTTNLMSGGWRFFIIENSHLTSDPNLGKSEKLSSEKKATEVEALPEDKSSVLGEGNEGKIVFAWDLTLKEKVVVKIYHAKCSPIVALNEQRSLIKLDAFYGRMDYTSQELDKHLVIMRYYAGMKNLMSLLYKQDASKDENERLIEKIDHSPLRKIRIQLKYLEAALFLQSKGITHGDAKPDNALIDSYTGDIRFIDFGSSLETEKIKGDDIVGTPGFMAPELDRSNKEREKRFDRIDNYTVGMSLIEILTTRHFRQVLSEKLNDIAKNEGVQRELTLDEIKQMFPDVFCKGSFGSFDSEVKKLMDECREAKLTTEEISRRLQDLVFKCKIKDKLVSVIESLIKARPSERMSFEDAIKAVAEFEQELATTYKALRNFLIASEEINKLGLVSAAALIAPVAEVAIKADQRESTQLKRLSFQQHKQANQGFFVPGAKLTLEKGGMPPLPSIPIRSMPLDDEIPHQSSSGVLF